METFTIDLGIDMDQQMGYTVTVERTVKERMELWVAKAFEIDNPAHCIGTVEGWSEIGARNNLNRLMQAKFQKTLKEIVDQPARIINYRNL